MRLSSKIAIGTGLIGLVVGAGFLVNKVNESRREEKARLQEQERIVLQQKKLEEYRERNGLLEGQDWTWMYVPSQRDTRRVVFDKDGNPLGFNVLNNSGREHVSNSSNPRHYEAWVDSHGGVDVGDDMAHTETYTFDEKDATFMRNAYQVKLKE